MARSERLTFRASPVERDAWRAASRLLGLEDESDYVRRACNDLADRTLPTTSGGKAFRGPDPRKATIRR